MKKQFLSLALILTIITIQSNAQLNGTYTIGPSGNYSSFTAAISALTSSGISGPVIFNIAPGTYNQQVTIPAITGTNSINTITFQSASGDSTSVILTYAPTLSSYNYTVKLNQTNYIIIKSITIQSAGTGLYGQVLKITGSSNCKFLNNIVKGVVTTSSSEELVLVFSTMDNGLTPNNNKFFFNSFINGSYSFFDYFNPLFKPSGTEISNNNFINQGYRSVYLEYQSQLIFSNNKITNNVLAINRAMRCVSISDFIIEKNIIEMPFGVSFGMEVFYMSSLGVIKNNFISVNGVSSNSIAIRLSDSYDIEVYNNSVFMYGSNSNSIGLDVYNYHDSIYVKNNIIVNNAGGLAIKVQDGFNGATLFSNHNDFISSGNYLGHLTSIGSATNIAGWQNITGQDANSVSIDPMFYSNTNLHVSNPLFNNLGTPLASVIDDIDGELRSLTTPDIGADEFSVFAKDIGPIELIHTFSGECFTSNETIKVKLKNYGINTLNFSTDNVNIYVTSTGLNPLSFPVVSVTSGSLLPDSTKEVIISTNYNMSVVGNYLFDVVVVMASDGNNANNTIPTTTITNAQVSTFPYIENIETFTTGYPGTLNNGWTTANTSTYHWKVQSGSTPTSNTGPLVDHTTSSTTGKYVCIEADSGSTGNIAYFYSPCIALGTLSNPKLSFWYHMYGAGIGSLKVDIYNGSSWVNNVFTLTGQQQISNAASWQQAIVSLSAYSGTIKVRFKATRGTTNFGDIGIDDISISSAPAVNLGPNVNICTGGSVTLNAGTGSGFTYSWTKLPLPTVIGTNQTLVVTNAGTYIVVVTNSFGLVGTDTINVTVSPPPTVTMGSGLSVCAGSSKIITGASATSYSSLLWTTSGTGTYTNATVLSPTYNPSAADILTGSVYLTLNVIGISPCGNAIDSVLLTINPLPVVSYSGLGTSYCEDANPVVLIGNPSGGTFSGTGVSGSSFNPTTAGVGTHLVTYSYMQASTGCTGTHTKSVLVKALPAVSFIGLPPSVCYDYQTYTLSGSPTGGTFSGTGISGNIFSPQTAGVGTHNISYISPPDANGCSNTQVQTIMVMSPPTVSFTGFSLQYCANSSPVTLTGNPSGGVFSGSGISGNTFYPSLAGIGSHNITYSYTGTNGCNSTTSSTTVIDSVPLVNAGSDFSINYGTSTVLSGTASGSGPFSYLWSPSNLLVTPSIQNPITQTLTTTTIFTLQVTNTQTYCQNTDQVQVTISGGALTSSATATQSSICNGQSTQLIALGSGGTGNFTYSWNSTPVGFSSTIQSPVVSPTTTTTYTVQINDGITTSSSSATVTVNPIPAVSLSGINSTYCSTDSPSAISVSPVGGTLTGPGVVGTSFNPSIISNGNIQVIYSYANTFGCVNRDTAFVQINKTPFSSAGQDNTLPCGYPGIQIGSTSQPGLTYLWTPTAGLSNSTISNPIASPAITTLYAVTTTNPNSGCYSSDSILITVAYGPTAQISNDTSICTGETITITASGGSSYSWNTTASTSSITVSPTVTSTYIVTVTQGLCIDVDSMKVTVLPLPNIDLGNDTTICKTQILTLDAGSGFTSYLWSTGATTQTIVVDSILGSGTYSVTITNNFSCSNADNILVTFNPCIGFAELSKEAEFKIYPNPTKGVFTIEGENLKSIEIININGQIIKKIQDSRYKKKNSSLQVDLSSQPKGVYFIRLWNDDFVRVEKVVLQ